MNEVKPWYKSNTVWGIVFSALAFLASQFLGVNADDIPVPPNPDFEQLKAIAEQVKAAKGNVAQIASVVLGSLAALYAIYNRITAKAKLDA